MAQVTTNVNFRMDKNLKIRFEKVCNELGLSMSTAFTVFAKTMVRQQRVPFDISLEVPNEETLKSIENIEKGKNLSKRFTSVEELMEDLNA
ncbi:MAG: type II toxin-antitoxin system RelB/DinJ family antitoxin [Phascolarctobacterium sp.]|jgi:DNA-damage-inducible protein J|nr:type II toxin-antitoxin system RelB/DinJ family antitoxin [Phascolarctobacterium sp.]